MSDRTDHISRKPQLRFTHKAWNKFDEIKQEKLLEKFEIIIPDYLTRNERIIKNLKKFNVSNLNRGIDKFNHGIDSFKTALDEIDASLKKH